LFVEKYKFNIVGYEEFISAWVIGRTEAKLLQVHAGKAGLLVTAVGYINGEVPLWYERTLHRADGREFRCRVTPAQSLRRLHERMIVEKRQLTADELPSPSGDLDGERGTQRDVRGRQS